MDGNAQGSGEINDVLAFFTVGQCSVRVEVATCSNRHGSLGVFDLNGVCYVVIANGECGKVLTALTRREREIASQIALGYGTKQIALHLGISPHTTITYVNRIRTKLRVRNRPEMVAALLRG
jgi:DNA-binding CsgD family transcriptional regulator